jgi:hypothetical protein
LLINNAFIKFIKERKETGTIDTISYAEMKNFLDDSNNDKQAKRPTNDISKEEV